MGVDLCKEMIPCPKCHGAGTFIKKLGRPADKYGGGVHYFGQAYSEKPCPLCKGCGEIEKPKKAA